MSSKTPDYSKSAEIEAQGYRDAAKIQAASEAENRALQEKLYNQQLDYLNQQEDYNRGLTQQNQANWQPYVDAGKGALGDLQNLYQDENSWLNQKFTADDLSNDAGYQFRLQQGQSALNNSLAAGNGVLSGAAQKALSDYNQGSASNEFQNAYNRDAADKNNRYQALLATMNAGIQGTSGYQNASTPTNIGSQLAGVSQGYGDNVGQIISNGANAQSSYTLNAAQSAANYNQLAQNASVASSGKWTGALSGAVSGAAMGAMAGGLPGAIAGGVGGAVAGYAGSGSADAGKAGGGFGSLFATKSTQSQKV